MPKKEEQIKFCTVNDTFTILQPTDTSFIGVCSNAPLNNTAYNANDMMFEKNAKSLKIEINSAILRKNQYKRKVSYNDFKKDKDTKILQQINHDLTGETIKAYNISLAGEEIQVINGHLLIYGEGAISIYRVNEHLQLKKVKVMRTHLLLFLIKSKAIGHECRLIFYNILLTLTEQKVKKIETMLEEILLYLDIDILVNMEYINEHLVCEYRSGVKQVFNNNLLKMEGVSVRGVSTLKNDELRYEGVVVKICNDKIEVNHLYKSFVEVLSVPGIRQHVACDNLLFLLTEKTIRVLKFIK